MLCNLSKVFDERLANYLFMNNGFLSDHQLGIQDSRNTELAGLHMIDRILPAYEKGTYCIFLYFVYFFSTHHFALYSVGKTLWILQCPWFKPFFY